ncbi:hypothetical protein [Clostridium sp.]|uniref:hypothetical protein n=1 Tax=Clostridium sp. TaxID=1506 RepID=UPI001DF42F97|nr:hypothetical protein [Clostridium sp.]MBS5306457.1 hypothetical protein [Clostridium sp.]
MIAVTYKEIDRNGTVHLPFMELYEAKNKSNALYKRGYLNVKVVKIEEKVLYTPGE